MTNGVRKKVLYFIPEFPRLTETFIEREVSKLLDFGNLDVRVFSMHKVSGKLSETVSEVTTYRRLDPITFILALVQFGVFRPARCLTAFRLILGPDKTCFLKRGFLFLKALGYARLFSKFHPGHIHVHFLSWPSTLGMVASILLNVPYSISGHARDVMVDGSLIPSKVKTAKFISICNKYAYRSCIEKSGVKFPTNIYQQYHGVDASKISLANPKMHKPERAFVFVGSRLVEKKGLSYVISASKLLKQRGIAHEIHIAGPGPLYKTLLEQIKQEGVEDTVEIHGEGKGVPWDDILEFYKVADVFAHPSIDTDIGDVDGVPTFVIEAALAKVPIVTTSVGSITDLITHEETGILVPQKDPRALADGIEKMIFDEGLRKRLIDNAYAKAREMFDLDKNVKALEDLLLK